MVPPSEAEAVAPPSGKSVEVVDPVIYTYPAESSAMAVGRSTPLPPMKLRYNRESAPEAAGLIFATKMSWPPGAVGFQHQISFGTDGEAVHTLKLQTDAVGIGARTDCEVIFQLAAGAVVNQVDAGVNRSIADSRVIGHAGAPVLFPRAEKIAGSAAQRIGAGNLGFSIGVEERNRNGALREAERGSARGQEQAVLAGAGGELHVPSPSARIGLEHDGKLSQDIRCSGDRRIRALGAEGRKYYSQGRQSPDRKTGGMTSVRDHMRM